MSPEYTPRRIRSRSRSGGSDGKDDLNYVDEDSDLSSGDDLLNSSDIELQQHMMDSPHSRKRGRPKSQPPIREEKKFQSSLSSNYGYSPSLLSNIDYDSDHDESGETKVDKYGRLLGGREYRVPTFQLPTRDETLFMFSKDPAALLGFRDSFVFLKKNVKLIKVHINNVEKGFLVDARLLRSTFRTREISVVTARSVFKQFGHRIVKRGRKGRDDYYYTEELDDGEDDQSEEEYTAKETAEKLPVTSTWIPPPTFTSGMGNLRHIPSTNDHAINDINWMHHAAVSTRQFNSSLYAYRRANPINYDLLTNVYQIPENKQILNDTGLRMIDNKETLEDNNTMNNHHNMHVNNEYDTIRDII
ncbi:chromatin remodelling complex Rsc7/Swp82 subunit-domain-containing protein [Pilobolus umbonatus]|nr:chromatin remodelling complex Rsc7/Swp82 subunit-domain-containing protein [Pilobolus umbonatus]